jgi:SAM-dependent methyltransferase
MKLENMSWEIGNALPLPFADASFSLVITRYSFHHFLVPEWALAEMIRVCRPGGRMLMADVAVAPEQSAAYDRMEKMRDPSHTHALTEPEFAEIFSCSGLDACRRSAYPVHVALDEILKASFPNPGDKDRLRQMITDDIGVNALGINARREGGKVMYSFPIAIFVGSKE